MHTLQRVLQQSAILSLILHLAGSGVNLSGVPVSALVAVFKEGGTKTLMEILKDLVIQV